MNAFEWTNPTTINEAVKLLQVARGSDVDEAPRPIAGGQDLLTTMKDYIVASGASGKPQDTFVGSIASRSTRAG